MEIRRNIYDTAGNKAPDTQQANGDAASSEERKTYHCFSCGLDCTRIRYHYTRSARNQKQIELCPNCYLEGRLPNTATNADFVKMEDPTYSAVDRDTSPWTDQETLLLLEGLEMFNDDWNAIADHVGTRTREQCVIRFLQLPIEDPYLEEKPESLGPLQYTGRQPFTQADNPVLSVVAFLASIVDPKVAAAAAKSSVDEMTKNLHRQIELNETKKESKQSPGATTETAGASTSSGDKDKAASTEAAASPKKSPTPAVKTETTTGSSAAPEDTPMSGDASPPASSDTENLLTKSASVALGAAAARASALASHEEREMTRLVNAVVNTSLRKLELKLVQFNELEQVLQAERREIEKARQNLFLERLAMKKQCLEVQSMLRRAQEIGGQQGIQMAIQAGQMGGQGQPLGMEPQGAQAQGIPQQGMRPPSLENPQGYVSFEA